MWHILSQIHFSEPPQPNLQLQSPFSEPYSTEKVVLKCTIDGSSDWNIKWNRNHLEISGSDLFLSEEGSKLTITTETSAVYTCRGEHKIKGISTKDSNTLEIKVKGKFVFCPYSQMFFSFFRYFWYFSFFI